MLLKNWSRSPGRKHKQKRETRIVGNNMGSLRRVSQRGQKPYSWRIHRRDRPLTQARYQAAGSIQGRLQEGPCRRGTANVSTRRSVPGKHQTTWTCSLQRLQFPPNHTLPPDPSTCWMVQRLTSRSLTSSRWLTPFGRSTRMYSRCSSVRLGCRPGKRPSARALAWPATGRSLIEFRHHSLKASTIENWSLLVDVEVPRS